MIERTRRRLVLAVVVVGAVVWSGSAHAQFVLDQHVVRPIARSYEVKEVSLDARIRDQVSEVRLSQVFHNPGSATIDAEFYFPLPEDGAVQNFVLLVDGRELPGRLLPKDEARRIYEEIVRTRRDPALLEYMGRGLYRTSVFPIPPGADRTVTMRYTGLCKRDRDVVEFAYPFSTQKFTAKPIQKLSFNLRIESRDSIKSIYCPTYDARIDRSGDHEARISFEQRDVIPTADFRLITTLSEGKVGASLLSYRPSQGDDGYFLLLASPEVRAEPSRRQPKSVVFVLDKSGSMAGKKIEQARNALRFVLQNLRDDDTFNIVTYDDRVETFKPELVRYSPNSRQEAERYIDNIREGGSTNIDAALQRALGQLRDGDRPSYVLFLTDGLPTAGQTNEKAIAADCREANKVRARVFVFGVGFDVNARLLDRISAGNSGTSEYVKPDDDIESHVARFYSKMTSPVLAGIEVEFEGISTNRTYPRDIPDLFEGGQLVLAGRYTRSGRTTVRVSGKVGGERRTLTFESELASPDSSSSYDFVEKLWATRRVGELIDQIDLHGQSKELVDELVALSTKYGLLTPYTAFLADERVQLHAWAENGARTRENLRELEVLSGSSGVDQRGMKQNLKFADRAAAPGGMTGMGMGGRMSGMGGGMGGMVGGPATGPAAPVMPGMGGRFAMQPRPAAARAKANQTQPSAPVPVAAAEAAKADAPRETLRSVGTRTFFRKGNRWVESTLKPEDEAKAVVVKQFSDAYFKLAREQKAEMNQYLTFNEPVAVRLDGKVYLIEP
ncbi:MAG: VIT domain-containing protein [Isosphaeraceae bacterium]